MDITEILWSMIPGGLAGAALTFLLRGWISQRLKQSIKNEYDHKLADHKAQLKRDNDVYLAELNAKHENAKQLLEHNLELARLQHQIKFAGSYQEILKAIKDIHAKLIEIQRAMNSYTSIFGTTDGPSRQARREKVGQLVEEFWDLFNPQRILLSDALDKEIVLYIHEVTDKGMDFMIRVERQELNGDETRENWMRLNTEVREQWNTVLASIRIKFKSILGVETTGGSNNSVEDIGA